MLDGENSVLGSGFREEHSALARGPRSKTGLHQLGGTDAGHPPAHVEPYPVCACDPSSGIRRYAGAKERIPVEGPDLQFIEAVIDNGDLGRHVVRFESGLLARQAGGSATVYLDGDTMVLSATTAQSKPR